VREGSGKRRKEKSQIKLQISVPVSGLDLASLLEGRKGFSSAKTGPKYFKRSIAMLTK
jgi:hypothetical protein